jgi:phosphatidate cytidylyltransferase
MLRTRVITALVLLALLALALWPARPWGFPLLALLFVAFGTSEWLVLAGLPSVPAAVLALLSMIGTGLFDTQLAAHPSWLAVALGLAGVIWIALTLNLLVTGQFPTVNRARPAYVVLGLVLPSACALAILAAYREGLIFMVSIMALVWAADIAAYFSGRAFGRHKLAPSISPGKTIEGAIGGVIAVWLVAGAAAHWPGLESTLFARVWSAFPLAGVLVALTALTGLSIVGDLFESHLKRQAGVKDSGRLLPGHGGMLDRIDALLPVIPAALLLSQRL